MDITEITFNALWTGLYKAQIELADELSTLRDDDCDRAKALHKTLDELATKKKNLAQIANDNNFSDEAFMINGVLHRNT